MKIKLIVPVLFCFILSTTVFAQDFHAVNKGDVLMDIGFGIWGNHHQYTPNNFTAPSWAINPTSDEHYFTLPALSMTLQKSFWNDVTLGGQAAYNGYTREYDYQQSDGYYQHSRYKAHNLFFMARGEYHFNRIFKLHKKCDLYAGLIAGYRFSTSRLDEIYEGDTLGETDYPTQSSSSNGFDGGIFAGFRYKVKHKMFVYGELGYAITVFRGGIAWRF